MKVIISAGGKFYSFEMAKQLLKHDYLERLITSIPRSYVIREGIPKEKVTSLILKELIVQAKVRLPDSIGKIYNTQYLNNNIFDWQASRKITKSDIVVVWSGLGLTTLKKAKKLDCKTIVEHGSSHPVYQSNLLKREYKSLGIKLDSYYHPKLIEKMKKEFEEADYISVPSTFVEKSMITYNVPKENLLRVPYGVDTKFYKPLTKRGTVFRVVYLGSLCIRKGVHLLLKAFSELKLNDAELVLGGRITDEIKPFLKKYEGTYRYVGHIKQEKLPDFYSQGSVFCLPSIEEGMALVQLQAMACGLPLICTTNTGGEDLIGEGKEGFVIQVNNLESLKEKILYLYKNPDKCKKMGLSARRKVTERFTWDNYGKRVIKNYEKILN